MTKPLGRVSVCETAHGRFVAPSFAPFVALFAALVVFFVTTRARADDVKAWVDQDTVALGEPFQLHFNASSSDTAPSDPRPGVPATIKVQGSQSMPSHMVSIVNGVRSDSAGLQTTWSLVATSLGTFMLRPTVTIGRERKIAPNVIVHVVAQGQAPPPRQQGLFSPGFPNFPDPFQSNGPNDPWSGLLGPMMGDDDTPNVRTDPKLSLDQARARGAFLHASIDKTSAVVGEQVTLSIYLYVDTGSREPDFNDVHEAPCSDFLKRQLLDDNSTLKAVGYAKASGRIWTVKVLRRLALFPIKTGTLTIGPMTLGVVGPMGGASMLRDSEALDVHVTEPPMNARPPGYVVGDVGAFKLEANVDPRRVDRGGASAVTLELSGTGNLPANVTPPTRRGLEWLAPEIHEQLGNVGQDRWGGKRTFAYVLHAKEAGTIDLGSIKLPYFDPATHTYGVAEAALGTIEVTPNGTTEEDAGASSDPLPGLPRARDSREGTPAVATHIADRPYFWFGLAASPLAFAVFAGSSAAARRLRAIARTKRTSKGAELSRRFDEADAACAGTDAARAEAAIARAIEAACEVKAKIAIRGATTREAGRRLADGGVAAEVAEEIAKILEEGEAARFSASALAMDDARGRWKRAKSAIEHLETRSS